MSDMFAVVEIMGRRQRAGRISDATIGGAVMLRVEHPTRVDDDGRPVAEYYTPAALFAIRPCTEAEAITANRWAWPDPKPELGPGLPPELAELVDDEDLDDEDLDDDGDEDEEIGRIKAATASGGSYHDADCESEFIEGPNCNSSCRCAERFAEANPF